MGADLAYEITRECLEHAERHGFTFPSEVGVRVLVTERGIASLRAVSPELARLTLLIVPVDGEKVELTAQLSDFSGLDPDAELLDWAEDGLVLAKRMIG